MFNSQKFCFDRNYHHHVATKRPETVTLTTGTSSIGDQATANTDVIFAGTSSASEPTLQFIGPATYTGDPSQNTNYSVRSLTVAGNPYPGGGAIYGALNVEDSTNLTVTNGSTVTDGELDIRQAIGSSVTLDGNSTIDNGGTVTDAGGGRQGGTSLTINGTLTLGLNGTNIFEPGITGVSGPGIIRELSKLDVVSVGAVGKDFHVDIRAGSFSASSSITDFNGTIGPAAGSNAPTLGDTGVAVLSLANNEASLIKTATFDTSTGMLSLLDAGGSDVDSVHFTGNASSLNFSIQNNNLVINNLHDIPGTIPLMFS